MSGPATVGRARALRDEVRPDDRQRVASLVAATGRFNPEEVAVAAELVGERLRQGSASGYEFLFLEGDGELLGYACHGRVPGTVGSHDLYWIAVDPGLQGLGLGGLLLAEAERRARLAGDTDIWVETAGRAEYAATRDFYERHGYRTIARLPGFYAPGDDKIVYHKALGEPDRDGRP